MSGNERTHRLVMRMVAFAMLGVLFADWIGWI